MTQKIIDVNNLSDETKKKILILELDRLKEENEELSNLVEASKVLHYKDNFKIVREAKENYKTIYFNQDGEQLPF